MNKKIIFFTFIFSILIELNAVSEQNNSNNINNNAKQNIKVNKNDKNNDNQNHILITNDNFKDITFNKPVDGNIVKNAEKMNNNKTIDKKSDDKKSKKTFVKGSIYTGFQNINNDKPLKNIQVGGTIDTHYKINDDVSVFVGLDASGCVNCESRVVKTTEHQEVFKRENNIQNQNDKGWIKTDAEPVFIKKK